MVFFLEIFRLESICGDSATSSLVSGAPVCQCVQWLLLVKRAHPVTTAKSFQADREARMYAITARFPWLNLGFVHGLKQWIQLPSSL